MIPLTDLTRQYAALASVIEPRVLELLRTQSWILGPTVRAFEDAVAAYLSAPGSAGVSSGTDALLLCLKAAGVGAGDEVITTPLTFVATAEVICRIGAVPVFVDVEEDFLGLDPLAVERAISPRTKAVIAVHLFGHLGFVDELAQLCVRQGLVLIEDAAQAFGAKLGPKSAGTFGTLGGFSFFPAKVLGAFGDGGLIVGRAELIEEVRSLREHGHDGSGNFVKLGGNHRLDALQAAILHIKLEHVETFLAARRRIAARYTEALEGCAGLIVPRERVGAQSAWNYYVLRVREPRRWVQELARHGVQAKQYYPRLLPTEACFRGQSLSFELSQAEHVSSSLLALPLFPELLPEEVEQVIRATLETARTLEAT